MPHTEVVLQHNEEHSFPPRHLEEFIIATSKSRQQDTLTTTAIFMQDKKHIKKLKQIRHNVVKLPQ